MMNVHELAKACGFTYYCGQEAEARNVSGAYCCDLLSWVIGRAEGEDALVTVMSNLGFFRFCEEQNIHTVSTKVGDRYVLEEMRRMGYVLGGEQSGHIILTRHATTGDGQLSAVQLLTMVRRRGWKMSRAGSLMERYPQVMVNVRADTDQKKRFNESTALQQAVKAADEALGTDGRVLVRVSGTEPLVRIMVEGKDFDRINDLAMDLADQIKKELAAPAEQ